MIQFLQSNSKYSTTILTILLSEHMHFHITHFIFKHCSIFNAAFSAVQHRSQGEFETLLFSYT